MPANPSTAFGPAPRDLSAIAILSLLALIALPALVAGCGENTSPPPEYSERGDLSRLEERGLLRILVPPRRADRLASEAFPLDLELQVAKAFAARLGLEPVIVQRPRDQLLDALAEGRGDLVAARVKVTSDRRERFLFSIPVDHVREVLVLPEGSPPVETEEDLAHLLNGLEITLPADGTYGDSLGELQRDDGGPIIQRAPEHLDDEQLLYRIAQGKLAATIADEDLVEAFQRYQGGVEAVFPITEDRPIAWALRPNGRQLKEAADRFLHESALTADLAGPLLGDLEEIRQRGVLRVLTRNTPATYFLYRGAQMGFEYELARRFARSLGVRLQIRVQRQPDRLIPALRAGEGDLIAASFAVSPKRLRQVAFSQPYNYASELVVVRTGDPQAVATPEDLAGRTVPVHADGAHRESLEALEKEHGFAVEGLPPEVETLELLDALADGTYDQVVVNSNELDIELAHRDDIESAFPLGPPREIAWATRPEDEELRAAVDAFLLRQRKSEFLAVLKEKYFGDRNLVTDRLNATLADAGRISPFDPLFQQYGGEEEFDWRLLASQAYQESRFDPQARSWAGAIGLMQIMPRTARHMKVRGDLRDPAVSIAAGTQYLNWLMQRFEPSLPFAERLRFALAAYNAGHGHVRDGRRLARELGYDPDVWFDNVEKVIVLLSQREYARRARYGYCRCQETVDYVRHISDRYSAYVQVKELRAGLPEEGGEGEQGVGASGESASGAAETR
ncbi:MAG: transporter substrate-binding domain-containing protein [Acidobacteriota bacterium]|nr:transporter substrate-binding domain-containing protein [Acidobacteriota bacterium]